jgi:hypothetical protein
MSSRRRAKIQGFGDGRREAASRRARKVRREPGRFALEPLEDRRLLTVTPATVTGQGTILNHQDAFSANVAASVVYGVAGYSGSLTFSDAKAGDTFTATSITSVQITESPTVTGTTTTNGGFTITGTASLNGGTGVYSFTASGSLPFPANAGSTGGVGFVATGPNNFSYNTPWHPWDPGQTVAIAITQPTLVPTTTHLTSSANPAVAVQPVTFTAAVTPGASVSTPLSGYVAFVVDSRAAVNEPVVNGQATYATTSLGVGTHTVTATYLGTSLFASSGDMIASQVVNQASSTTTLAYSGSFVVNQPLSLRATVATAAPSYAYPTGSVTFMDNGNSLGTLNLSGTGTSQYVTLSLPTGLPAGAHSITAVYGGDANVMGSTSAAVNKTVTQLSTSTSLATTVNPVVVGNPVTLTATVAGSTSLSGGAKPSGSVTFYDGGAPLGTAPLSGGVAQLPTSFATAGSHALTAVYGGDATFSMSTGALSQSVASAPSASHVVLSSSASTAVVGQAVKFTVYVYGGVVGASESGATGTITLMDGKTPVGTASIAGGAATFTLSSLGLGSHSLTASYGGDANFAAAVSSALSEAIVTPGTVAGQGTTQGGQDSFSVNVVAALAGGVPSYSGSLTFSDAKAGDTFTAASITSVQIFQATPAAGQSSTNGYFIITGTASLAGKTGVYSFTATGSLPFPSNAGSTGGLAFQATGPNGFSYSTPWHPWDPGETIVVTASA